MKPIKVTETHKQKLLKDFEKQLTNQRMSDGKFKYESDLSTILSSEEIKKPTIQYTADAYLKMMYLIKEYTSEVGWHGLVKHFPDKNFYFIYDIIVYPQQVSGANVTTDDKEYGEWLHKELDDNTFNNLRFQGHSHVNMSTTPSGTDTQMYNDILQNLHTGDFYIFAILNKKGDSNYWIYDFKNNIIFEHKDIKIEILAGTETIDEWLQQQEQLIEKNTLTSTQFQHWYNSSYWDDETDIHQRYQNKKAPVKGVRKK